ncbi:M17 family peptidase N-terminal domain-containing protein [Sphingomonas sp. R1]|uniref:M17 family peptidase N-terminal domain-containing protein n=1 Tax=Sphingomonas sp. R1 TaxID=399176 RepID=UPI002224FADC|nr:M17 family peptidase N-terminal domain-containing protein [Sphingomonas sp. R1]UYY77169.1 peptidase M17 [Sphingomonas sp. R1]
MHFAVAEIDVLAADMDLLIVGMLEKDVAGAHRGGADALDHALHGTLSRLRQGGIFTGGFGETLMLARPAAPIRAGTVMLVGMGASLAAQPAAVGNLTGLAMRAALRIGAASVGCLLGWSELDIAEDQVAHSAAAMMRGALGAIDAQHGEGQAPPMAWTFDIRNGDATRTAAALAAALAAWP